MTDFIALLILVLILGLAVAYIVKAKRRGVKCIGCPAGGNCPSARKMKRKKLDGPVIGKRILKISGMHCEHCARNVTIILHRIDGVTSDVSLSAGRAVVSYDRDISNEVLKDAVEKIGYQVVSIS